LTFPSFLLITIQSLLCSLNTSTSTHRPINTSYKTFIKMVSFRNIVAAMALSIPVIAQTTPAQVVQNIQLITQKSQALQRPAQSISIVNGPLILIGQGPFPVGAPFRL
jgi:hypothetical protein